MLHALFGSVVHIAADGFWIRLGNVTAWAIGAIVVGAIVMFLLAFGEELFVFLCIAIPAGIGIYALFHYLFAG